MDIEKYKQQISKYINIGLISISVLLVLLIIYISPIFYFQYQIIVKYNLLEVFTNKIFDVNNVMNPFLNEKENLNDLINF